ncbi:hypothetical protein [Yersinia pekkanenii]|uniref:Uncharacterized protein n=1 Tax=Yersinia pekkanenii TaxID=1288385 RepID=A0A0T9RF81_9GAMM|nr:hypothetical protein [Yersinia pekkanenii]CNI59910.1 Uncharacterised protein [Yersinia pekkanenii]CRY69469.1 Uncharacterised protein [Yersinia pekkanenii]
MLGGADKSNGEFRSYNIGADTLDPYTGSSVEFYKIPDRVLEHIGFSQRQDSFNNENDTDA